MPKNLGQSVVFGVLMVIVMVYFMICYNISMDMGGLTPAVFLLALEELPIMAAIAFVLEFVALGKLAKILAFRFVNPATDKPMIDGQKVLIVPVEDHLEFNGVAVNVNRDKE